MNTLPNAVSFEFMDIDSLLSRVVPLMDSIDLSGDIPPTTMGAINSVEASGASVSDTTVKLLLLKKQGVITFDEYVELDRYLFNKDK